MSRSDLDFDHMAFSFRIYDRNLHTTRESQWLVLHRPGLSFAYRLHEQLRVADSGDSKLAVSRPVGWSVREVEVKGRQSWHTQHENHGHTQSFNRYQFDLALLREDLKELPDDNHVLYYLGATNFAALEALLGRGEHQITPEVTKWIDDGLKYFELRLQDHHIHNASVMQEQTWASMRWLAYAYQNFRRNFDKAEYWYQRCVAFDPPRADCPVFLSNLYRKHGKVEEAWAVISGVLKYPLQQRSFSNNFYIYQCSLPLEASLTIVELLNSKNAYVDSARYPIFLFGWKLLRTAQKACDSESLGYLLEGEDEVVAAEAAYRSIADHQNTGATAPSPLELLDRDELCIETDGSADAELMFMLQRWGAKVC